MTREELLKSVRGDIHPTLMENAVAWILDNCDISGRTSIPRIFGDTPVQKAMEDYIILILGL